ncbi:MAG: homoserine O-succinyltransferase [Tissierellia bacterium]|nr:homoserine O-succinyltransferase [Tissierellia bacterium]
MPIIVPENLPAGEILQKKENIFVMNSSRAITQDIRPLKIAILNLMPKKIETELQFLRLLSNSPLQIDVHLVYTASYRPSHTSMEYLEKFYKTFDEIKYEKYDGMIITGAPVEKLPFEEVDYWEEMAKIMDWSKDHVFSTVFVCWAAQAALYHFHGIEKEELLDKLFGVFEHKITKQDDMLKGFSDSFLIPHSRHTRVKEDDVRACEDLQVLSESEDAGIYLIKSKKYNQFFITGHAEYDTETLKNEYDRDVSQGQKIEIPKNYYENDDPSKPPKNCWRSNAYLQMSNWLNYYVYQITPYDINEI